MGHTYDAERYGIIERKYFGLTKKFGGETAAGFTLGTTDATAIVHVTRWYPKGPIRVVKAGSFTVCTLNGSGVDKIDARVRKGSLTASVIASWNAFASAQFSFASGDGRGSATVPAGGYVTIKTGTPETDKGTAQNTSTTTGTLAFFIDYTRLYHATKW